MSNIEDLTQLHLMILDELNVEELVVGEMMTEKGKVELVLIKPLKKYFWRIDGKLKEANKEKIYPIIKAVLDRGANIIKNK